MPTPSRHLCSDRPQSPRLQSSLMLALVLAMQLFSATTDAADTPRRVASMSLCVDELLLSLAEPTQVVAVSRLATDPRYSRVWQQAQRVPQHDGLAEQLVALQPDLLLAAEYEQGKATTLLRQLGYDVRIVPTATKLADFPAQLREVASWLGTEDRAETLLADWQQKLDQARRPTPSASAPLALSLAPNGYTPGQQSLKNELLHWTGYRTAADVLGLQYDSELTLEQIVLLRADYLFLEEQHGNRAALGYRLLDHPALQQQTSRRIAVTSADWLCPGLGLATMATQLAQARELVSLPVPSSPVPSLPVLSSPVQSWPAGAAP